MLTVLLVLVCVICITFIISLCIWELLGLGDKFRTLDKKTDELNTPYKCKCGIVSRKYQTVNGDKLICPHCDNRLMEYGDRTKEDREFPFAPKIRMKDVSKHLKNENEQKRLEEELRKLEECDKEIEAYEKLQLKKLKEYEEKANQIKAELKLKED